MRSAGRRFAFFLYLCYLLNLKMNFYIFIKIVNCIYENSDT